MTRLTLIIACALLAGCAATQPAPSASTPEPRPGPNQYEVFGKTYEIMDDNLGYLEIGIASWYGKKFHGRLTAMGDIYDMYAMTAAHKSLPLPTVVKVTNLDNGRSVRLRVNDRGPFHDDRLIDLSYGAARALGFENKGTAPVVVEALDEINHPALALQVEHGDSYYLQVGAFSSETGAERQLQAVVDALPSGVPARILTSETEDSILYKVWVGPMTDFSEEQQVERRLIDRNLGNPIRVTID
jgi:rare lipoprotein A